MAERILTTHVGSLPRPESLLATYRRRAPASELAPVLAQSVDDVVREQRGAGLDIVNDGEHGKPAMNAIDYAAWASYIYERVSGFEPRPLAPETNVLAAILGDSKDREDFADYYRAT